MGGGAGGVYRLLLGLGSFKIGLKVPSLRELDGRAVPESSETRSDLDDPETAQGPGLGV